MSVDRQSGSPLQDLWAALGLTRTEWTDLLGVAYSQTHLAEKGRAPLSRQAQQVLAGMGVDVADLERKQQVWIGNRARELRATLLHWGAAE
jgi:hypothetical protein